jgi:hypothetical protein
MPGAGPYPQTNHQRKGHPTMRRALAGLAAAAIVTQAGWTMHLQNELAAAHSIAGPQGPRGETGPAGPQDPRGGPEVPG